MGNRVGRSDSYLLRKHPLTKLYYQYPHSSGCMTIDSEGFILSCNANVCRFIGLDMSLIHSAPWMLNAVVPNKEHFFTHWLETIHSLKSLIQKIQFSSPNNHNFYTIMEAHYNEEQQHIEALMISLPKEIWDIIDESEFIQLSPSTSRTDSDILDIESVEEEPNEEIYSKMKKVLRLLGEY